MSNGLFVEIMGLDADVIEGPKKTVDVSFEKFNGTGAADRLVKRAMQNELAEEILGEFVPVVTAQREMAKQAGPLFEEGEFRKIFTRAAAEAFTADLSKRKADLSKQRVARNERLAKYDKGITEIVRKFKNSLCLHYGVLNADKDAVQNVIDACVEWTDRTVQEFAR